MNYKIQDIVNNDLCVGCGLCVSESKSSRMEWNENGFLVPILDNSFNENAIKVCPFNPQPEEEVRDEDALAKKFLFDANKQDSKIGKYIETYAGYSNSFRETSSSGGIATYIFEQLLLNNIVSHLFIVKEVSGTYEYQWFNNDEDIKNISKTRYIPITMEKLFLEIESKQGKIAISGVACFLKAIRLKQYYSPEFKDKIAFTVGIICGGLKSRFFTDYLAQNSGIKSKYGKQQYRVKDENSTASDYSFEAQDEEGIKHQVKMKSLGDMWGTGLFKSNACDFCDDVTTELADISLGDAWLPEYRNEGLGNSVIVTRSLLADSLIKSGIERGLLTVRIVGKEKIVESQKASFAHRQASLGFRKKYLSIDLHKRDRFKESLSLTYIIVQMVRRKTRYASLVIWRKYLKIGSFNKEMKPYLTVLKVVTKINHKFRKKI